MVPIVRDYLDYIRDNPQKYWFKAKWYGWGWMPVRWQGLVVVLAYLAVVVTPGILLAQGLMVEEQFVWVITPVTIVATVVLVGICLAKGERPSWSWGKPKKKRK